MPLPKSLLWYLWFHIPLFKLTLRHCGKSYKMNIAHLAQGFTDAGYCLYDNDAKFYVPP